MSRVGKMPVQLPKGVEVKVEGRTIRVKGPKGQLTHHIHDSMDVTVKDGILTVVPKHLTNQVKTYYGMTRALINNMVVGVTDGFSKTLTLVGVGYKAAPKGKGVTLNVGYSHPIDFDPPTGVDLKVDKQSVVVSGADKAAVGLTAAKIRSFRPPEPYHGKGIRYENEHVTIKVGKAAVKAGA